MSPVWLVLLLGAAACALLPVPDRWKNGPGSPGLPSVPTPRPSPTASPSPTPAPTPTPLPEPEFRAPGTVCVGEPFGIELVGVPYEGHMMLVADGKWEMGLFGINPAKRPALTAVVLRNPGERLLSVRWSGGILTKQVRAVACRS